MKKRIVLLILFLLCCLACSGIAVYSTTLKGGVVKVPDMIFGLWRVKSVQIETDSPASFKEKNVDLWNISQKGNVIYLSNPFSGASAQVEVNSSSKDEITFSKSGKYDGKILKDTVNIKISGENFTGTDELELKTLSDVNGNVIKTEHAKYSLKGEKIGG